MDYLEYIETQTNSFRCCNIENWSSYAYRGFFVYLQKNKIIPVNWWGYVPNPRGGFQCLTWHFINGEELNSIGLTENYLDELYFQIENDSITLKMSKGTDESREKQKQVRRELYDFFHGHIPSFVQPNLRWGNVITVGFMKYNHKNFEEKILEVQKIADLLKTRFKFPKA